MIPAASGMPATDNSSGAAKSVTMSRMPFAASSRRPAATSPSSGTIASVKVNDWPVKWPVVSLSAMPSRAPWMPFVLRRLVEIGERQSPLDRLRQPADPHRFLAGMAAACTAATKISTSHQPNDEASNAHREAVHAREPPLILALRSEERRVIAHFSVSR